MNSPTDATRPGLLDRCAAIDVRDFVPLLTAVIILLKSPDMYFAWFLKVPVELLTLAAIISPRHRKTWWLWYSLACLQALTIFLRWGYSDNHWFFILYWCLGLTFVYASPPGRQRPLLQINSRLLIGTCFAFATLWKVISDTYLDGTFFHYSLLVEPRWTAFSSWVGGISPSILVENRQLRDLLITGHLQGATTESAVVTDALRLRYLAGFLTWWTVAIEALIAVLFLSPNRRWVAFFRNALLLVFAVSTYAVATVPGFGWTLMVMGIAQTTDRQPGFRAAYIACFLLIQAYTIPFGAFFEFLLSVVRQMA